MTQKLDQATATMIKNLEEKSGKTMAQWTAVVRASGLAKHGEIVKHLKSDHGLTHGYANLVAHTALASDAGSLSETVDLVEAQYSGEKAALKPIYDRLMAEVNKFGKDVEAAPKKAYVSLRRSKQFALIQPTTKSRIDVGIQLKGTAAKGRLEASGSFNAMVSHRVRVESLADVNAELVSWLRQAYDGA